EQIAAGYKSRSDFLADLQLDPPTSTSDLAGPPHRDEDWLVLSTIHSAKGCEWDVVYLTHAADGFLPSDMSTGSQEEIEEELRLTYVALTRARDFLYITWPLRYYFKWYALTDGHTYAQRSRFLTDEVMASIDEVHLEYDPGDDMPMDIESGADIQKRIKNMWE
ncbi:ATP-dependent helicase, partial [Candidatus Bipolaricaulota bacterium]|nr:ATP-dependent helicase [Candidatus Bipolaricaulota bacterium]